MALSRKRIPSSRHGACSSGFLLVLSDDAIDRSAKSRGFEGADAIALFAVVVVVVRVGLETPHQPVPQHGVLPVVALRIPMVNIVVSHLPPQTAVRQRMGLVGGKGAV